VHDFLCQSLCSQRCNQAEAHSTQMNEIFCQDCLWLLIWLVLHEHVPLLDTLTTLRECSCWLYMGSQFFNPAWCPWPYSCFNGQSDHDCSWSMVLKSTSRTSTTSPYWTWWSQPATAPSMMPLSTRTTLDGDISYEAASHWILQGLPTRRQVQS
jgi:hypothetical protein